MCGIVKTAKRDQKTHHVVDDGTTLPFQLHQLMGVTVPGAMLAVEAGTASTAAPVMGTSG